MITPIEAVKVLQYIKSAPLNPSKQRIMESCCQVLISLDQSNQVDKLSDIEFIHLYEFISSNDDVMFKNILPSLN